MGRGSLDYPQVKSGIAEGTCKRLRSRCRPGVGKSKGTRDWYRKDGLEKGAAILLEAGGKKPGLEKGGCLRL